MLSSGHCPGCNVDFRGAKGLSLHLKLTQNDPCAAIFRTAVDGSDALPASLRQAHVPLIDNAEEFGDLSDHGLPRGNATFEGDFFGDNYTPEELGFNPDDEEDPPDSDDEEDQSARDHDDASRAGLEDGYEAPRPSAAAVASDADSPMPDAAQTTLPAPTREARKAAEDRFHRKPIVEEYPGTSAGKPISAVASETSEQVYKSSLGSSTDVNPYAPFNSKMDWEIAKWAKLRGSGSLPLQIFFILMGCAAVVFCVPKSRPDQTPSGPRLSEFILWNVS
ncbi:hypothetical protein B0H13DRAFT_1920855 [Mycena leptocephala]|nr:hypothetical protein B0H13DRAFT_1920855 [Mycena leptocephala]